jgi:hypothetical protein
MEMNSSRDDNRVLELTPDLFEPFKFPVTCLGVEDPRRLGGRRQYNLR